VRPLIELTYPSNFELILFGDNHAGSIMSHEHGLQECIEYIKAKKNRRAIHMGDGQEAIMINDPRFHPATQKDPPLKINEHFTDLLRPIRNRLDIMIQGNHERKLWPFGDLTKGTCNTLSTQNHQVHYGTFSCVAEIKDEFGLMFRIFLIHGKRPITSQAKDYDQAQGNMKARLKLLLQSLRGDCLVMAMGHTHRLLIREPAEKLYLYTAGKRIKQAYIKQAKTQQYIDPDQRWYVNTGSFYKLYTDELGFDGEWVNSYAELAMYTPMELGFVVIWVEDRQIVSIEKKVVV